MKEYEMYFLRSILRRINIHEVVSMRIAKNLSNVCLCVPDFFFCNMHRFFDGKNAPSEYLDKAFFLCIADYYHTTLPVLRKAECIDNKVH